MICTDSIDIFYCIFPSLLVFFYVRCSLQDIRIHRTSCWTRAPTHLTSFDTLLVRSYKNSIRRIFDVFVHVSKNFREKASRHLLGKKKNFDVCTFKNQRQNVSKLSRSFLYYTITTITTILFCFRAKWPNYVIREIN